MHGLDCRPHWRELPRRGVPRSGHAFEFDGHVKFVGRERGGFADDLERVLWEEKRREDWSRSLGFGISRIIWADLFGVRRRHTLGRHDREFRATQARLGHRVAGGLGRPHYGRPRQVGGRC